MAWIFADLGAELYSRLLEAARRVLDFIQAAERSQHRYFQPFLLDSGLSAWLR